MKKIIIYFAFCAFSILSSCSGNKVSASEVPQPVMSAFTAKYQGATDVKWITEKKDNKMIYEAQFKLNGKEIEAEFQPDGTFIGED